MPPNGWHVATIGEVVDPARKVTYGIVQPGPRQQEGVPIIRGGDYSSGRVVDDDLYRVLPAIAAKYERSKLCGDDILLSIVGYLGLVARVPHHLAGANITQTTARIAIAKPNRSEFFFQYFQSPIFKKQIERFTKGSAQAGLNLRDVERMEVLVPPVSEQRKIAAILSSVDDAIAATQAVIYELDVVRSGLLASAMAGKLTSSRSPTGSTPIGDMPKHWAVVSLNEVAQVKGGKRLPKGHPFAQTRTAYPYVRVSDLVEDSISTTDIKFISEEDHRATARYTISSDDLYISIAGTLGVVGEVPAELDGAHLTENAAKICQIDARRLDRTFLMFALQSDAAQDQLGRAKGVGAGVPKLALFRILTTLLPLPPLAEQQRIVGVLKSVRERVVQTRAKVVAMSGLKSGLADALLSGRLRVIDADVAA